MFASMLTRPGSGYFGSGLQQVVDRPFALSEWIHVYPNVYAAEGPAIMAAYGMGLQGWDASYEFQSQANRQRVRRHRRQFPVGCLGGGRADLAGAVSVAGPDDHRGDVKEGEGDRRRRVCPADLAEGRFGDIGGNFPWGVWEADVPTSLGQFPSLARMIYRGDVKEGEVISVRRVSPADLAEGRFRFSDKVEQQGDVKTFGGSVPPEALAAGRVVVEFTDKPQPSQLPDMSRYRQGSVIKSVTGQLAWDTSGQGFFTVNTAGTKAVVGFAGGKEQTLGDVKVRLDTPFASLFLTALERRRTSPTASGR